MNYIARLSRIIETLTDAREAAQPSGGGARQPPQTLPPAWEYVAAQNAAANGVDLETLVNFELET